MTSKFISYSVKEAISNEEKQLVFSIRYQSYLYSRLIQPNKNKLFIDSYDKNINAKSFILFQNNLPIGAIRTCVYIPNSQWNTIPAFEIYNMEIEKEIGYNYPIVESNRFCILPNYQKHLSLAILNLFIYVAVTALQYKSPYLITSVIPKHQSIYKSLTFETISIPKYYPEVSVKGVLMFAKIKKEYNSYQKLRNNYNHKRLLHFFRLIDNHFKKSP